MTSINDLTNKSVAILGFGQEGQAIADYLLSKGVTPTIFDGKDLTLWPTANLAKLEHLGLSAKCSQDFIDQALQNAKVIFRSPGIRISPQQYQTALQKSILITSQTQWFFEHSPAKIIGITGTKGKGTTSSLIYQILQSTPAIVTDKDTKLFLTGNIGKVQPLEFLDQLTEVDLVVYELSSFQLQDLRHSPFIGICLMVTSDHLDYHQDLEEYHSAKFAISEHQTNSDFTIYNIDYPASVKIGQQGQGQKWMITKTNSAPTQGAKIDEEHDQIHILSSKFNNGEVVVNCQDRLIRGKHNLENIAAASVATLLLGSTVEIIQQTIKTFEGLRHRLQFVTQLDGIKFYNDSVSTNPDTTVAAIKSFTEPLVLIVGGAVKKLDYSSLVEVIKNTANIKAVVTMGPAGEIIYQALQKDNYSKLISGPLFEFDDVIKSAKNFAEEGDVVLLSPGATSFDMFQNYEQRGEEFIKLVSV